MFLAPLSTDRLPFPSRPYLLAIKPFFLQERLDAEAAIAADDAAWLKRDQKLGLAAGAVAIAHWPVAKAVRIDDNRVLRQLLDCTHRES